MNAHVNQPMLCDDCTRETLARVENGEALDWSHCPHNSALALLKREHGRVIEWHAIGPISRDEALRRLHDVAAERAREYMDAPSDLTPRSKLLS